MSQAIALANPWKEEPVRWGIVAWMVSVHAAALGALCYFIAFGISWKTIVLTAVVFTLCHISITAGVHRLYAHPTYKAKPALEVFLLVLFSATFQSSAIWWASYHIAHHAYSDTEKDPYTVRHGKLWAHMIWIFYVPAKVHRMGDRLMKNRFLAWQHRRCLRIGFLAGFLLPTLIAFLWGDPIGGFLASFVRLVVQYHSTWCNNSVAHLWGNWLKAHPTARTNTALVVLNVGEGFHEEHHVIESRDYRLGRKWYHYDPGKWAIFSWYLLGRLAYDLKRLSDEQWESLVWRAQILLVLEAPRA